MSTMNITLDTKDWMHIEIAAKAMAQKSTNASEASQRLTAAMDKAAALMRKQYEGGSKHMHGTESDPPIKPHLAESLDRQLQGIEKLALSLRGKKLGNGMPITEAGQILSCVEFCRERIEPYVPE